MSEDLEQFILKGMAKARRKMGWLEILPISGFLLALYTWQPFRMLVLRRSLAAWWHY